ncbi:MAG: AraC family transcriptional regulator [Capsulimonas sp.]|uniref:AraC family transcriptional regulator n=1 Tax=Capsulimonas sp. TaxID=2494211 RepID=UPI003267466A
MHQPPIPFRNAGVHIAGAGQDHPFHEDQFWEVMYLRGGHIVCQQGTERFAMHPGMVIIHPPRIRHADFATTAYLTYYLWVDSDTAASWPRLCYDDEHKSLERVCQTVLQEWGARNSDREQMLCLLYDQMNLLLSRENHETASSGQAIVAAAEQIMETHYREKLTVGEIARRIGASPSSLHAHFARLRGQTPMDRLAKIRLRRALAQLHHTTLTLDSIASLCGYHSASHLSRRVKAVTGESPGRLRVRV